MTAIRLLLAALLAGLPMAAHAQSVGRTLVSVGEVIAVRGPQEIALRAGSEVRVGDTLRIGRDSNAQVRMNDQSIIALRAGTEFRIEQFQFRNDPANDSAFYRLLKGGIRTVTGLIGRVNQNAYRVDTPEGYLGIRGTHYSLVQCGGDCLNKDGSVAPNGTYGGVSDGRIAITNQTGEKVFGRDQYFYVASATAPPQSLIAPPAFLRDRLEGQVRSTSKTKTAEGAAAPAASGASSDARASTAEPVAAVAAAVTAGAVYMASEQRSREGGLSAVQTPPPPSPGLVFYPWTAGASIRDSAGNTGSLLPTGGVAIDLDKKRVFAAVNLTAGGIEWNLGTPGGMPLVATASGYSFAGEFPQAGDPNDSGGRCSQCPPNFGSGSSGFQVTSVKFSGTVTAASALTLDATVSSADLGRTVFVTGLPNSAKSERLERMVAMVSGNGSGFGAVSTSDPAFSNNARIDAGNELQSLRGIAGPWVAERGSAAHRLVGSRSDAGDLYWGVWTGAGATLRTHDYVTYTSGASDVEHWIHGKLATAVSTSLGASVNYSPVGGVVNGGDGRFNGGTINVDFTQQRINLIDLSATRASGETYVMNGVQVFKNDVVADFGGRFSTVTCSGGPACSGIMGGSYAGFFAGPNAEGIGLAFSAGNGLQGVSGVQAFKR